MLNPRPAVAKDKSFLSAVKCCDHLGGVVEAANVIEGDIRPDLLIRFRVYDQLLALGAGRKPDQKIVRVANRGRQADPQKVSPGEPANPLKQREQVPTPVIPREGMQLIDHDHLDVGEQPLVVDFAGDEHHLQRFGRGEEAVRRFRHQPLLLTRANVPMPHSRQPTHHGIVALEAFLLIVRQRLDRAQVEDRQPAPVLRERPGKQRKESRLCLSARCGRQNNEVPAGQDFLDGALLHGP